MQSQTFPLQWDAFAAKIKPWGITPDVCKQYPQTHEKQKFGVTALLDLNVCSPSRVLSAGTAPAKVSQELPQSYCGEARPAT